MFRDAIDWTEFLRLLAKVAVRHHWEGWAYCLMGNHFHLVVQLPYLGPSEGMQVLNAGYAVRTNARYKRTGIRPQPFLLAPGRGRGAPARTLPLCSPQSGSRRALPFAGRLAMEQLSGNRGARDGAPVPRYRRTA
jgi:hypothetical protein